MNNDKKSFVCLSRGQTCISESNTEYGSACGKICPVCGKTFFSHRLNQIYCSHFCRKEHKQQLKLKSALVKKCAYCGKEFITHRPQQIYCNRRCKDEMQILILEQRRIYPKANRFCAYCGKEFTTHIETQKYCSYICRREDYRKKKEKKPGLGRMEICRTCGAPFIVMGRAQKYCSLKCRKSYRPPKRKKTE